MEQFAIGAIAVVGIFGMIFLANDVREMNAYLRSLDDRRDQDAHGDSFPHTVFHSGTDSRKGQR